MITLATMKNTVKSEIKATVKKALAEIV